MLKLKKLTNKQRIFCREYLIDKNATQAAIRAGYAVNSARITASQLLTNPNISKFINDGIAKQEKRIEITGDRVIKEIAYLALDKKKIRGIANRLCSACRRAHKYVDPYGLLQRYEIGLSPKHGQKTLLNY